MAHLQVSMECPHEFVTYLTRRDIVFTGVWASRAHLVHDVRRNSISRKLGQTPFMHCFENNYWMNIFQFQRNTPGAYSPLKMIPPYFYLVYEEKESVDPINVILLFSFSEEMGRSGPTWCHLMDHNHRWLKLFRKRTNKICLLLPRSREANCKTFPDKSPVQ